MKFAVFILLCLSSSVLARPNLLPHDHQDYQAEGGEHHESSHNEGDVYNNADGAAVNNGEEPAINNEEGAVLNNEEGAPVQESEPIKIIKHESDIKEDGGYTFEVETADGLVRSETGTPGEDGAINQEGNISFTFPTGEQYDMKFVADQEGFKPESQWLPVAPEFPHPIPQFVLDQIEKAKLEDEQKAQDGEGQEGEGQEEGQEEVQEGQGQEAEGQEGEVQEVQVQEGQGQEAEVQEGGAQDGEAQENPSYPY